MASSKIEQFNDKNVGERVRDISFAYQKLKTALLTAPAVSEEQKLGFGEELKKVQVVIDRVLRGER